MSAGITDLAALLAQMRPQLQPHDYCYVLLPKPPDLSTLATLEPLAQFHEAQGYSAVARADRAQRLGLPRHGAFALITLQVHSSLNAVGLTAAVATALAEALISANVIAGYFHDHVLMPAADGPQALAILESLSARAEAAP